MKEKYETPEMEVVKFEIEDIIRTSGINDPNTPFAPFSDEDEFDLNQYPN